MTLSLPLPLSSRLRDVRGSAIRDLLALTARPEVISLAGGLPGTDLLPRERIAAALAAAVADPAAVQYGETAGLRRLREIVAAHESERIGRAVEADGVVVTSGSQQALDLVARAVLDPGDPVVVEDPVYVGALQVFQAAGAALHPVPVDDEGMAVDVLADHLAAGLRPRLVHTVASFHNPRGATLSPSRRAALAQLADRYGFLVVEDDPYGLLAFDAAPPVPVAAYGERVVRLGSASKVLAPALRVGWLTGPAELLGAVERLKQCTDLCTSSLTQIVAADLLADHAWFAAHLVGLRAALRERAGALTTAARSAFGPAALCSTPTGGMFCWLEFTDGTHPADLLPRALEHGVGFVPGVAFAVGRDLSGAARLCFASNPPASLHTAVQRLEAAWRTTGP
ncbi:PLP-dependent aminotransferase family protein [Pseudonocardia sp. MH-G8]|uniref:aminotransferase-like domain-containing protein n=1 Tax=Pseudonocardia sp. MH-G8 TaxID=1854588 RepID=UPI000BA0BE39|nr:PLP-dependent aminotransferase family protein [Pseudonocardia sp. MH-G8]OZM81626.1 aspartate aminotransferase [Pseudonocardia sp. MH-G8]